MEREMEGSGVGLALCSSHGLSLSTGVLWWERMTETRGSFASQEQEGSGSRKARGSQSHFQRWGA